jgi:hypothetical protein
LVPWMHCDNFRSILVTPTARDRSSEGHVAAIGALNLKLCLDGRTWLNWRSGGAHRWKVKTAGWEGWVVVRGKPAPLRL